MVKREEVVNALHMMKSDKADGEDEILDEFLKK